MDVTHYSVIPSYGRDYKTLDEARQAWLDGKDFTIQSIDRNNGRQMSIRDAQEGGLSVQVRYNKKRDIYVWPESAADEDEDEYIAPYGRRDDEGLEIE